VADTFGREADLVARVAGLHRPLAASEVPAGLDWDFLAGVFTNGRVAGLAHARLAAAGALDRVPPGAAAVLRAAYLENQFANALLEEEAGRLLSALHAGGLTAIPMKGLAMLAGGWYPDPGARRMGDMDLLVAPADAGPAAGALVDLGYLAQRPLEIGAGALDLSLKRGSIAYRIDLTWTFLHRTTVAARGAEVVESLIARAIPAKLAGTEVRVLRREDAILHAAGHVALHHDLNCPTGLADLSLLLTRGGQPDWDDLHRFARRVGLARTLAVVLAAAAAVLGTDAGPRAARRWPGLARALGRTPAGGLLDAHWMLGLPAAGEVLGKRGGLRRNLARLWWNVLLRDTSASRRGYFVEHAVPGPLAGAAFAVLSATGRLLGPLYAPGRRARLAPLAPGGANCG
jgi:hypothetical protein